MGYAYKYGYGVKKARASLPCLTNAVFLTKSVNKTGIVNKLSGGDAKFVNSNCLECNGVDTIFDIEDLIVYFITRSEIMYSLNDGVTWIQWNTGDEDVSGLFLKEDWKVSHGFDGTNYFTGLLTRIIHYTYDVRLAVPEFPVLDFTLAEGDSTMSINRADESYVDDYVMTNVLDVFSTIPTAKNDTWVYEDSATFKSDIQVVDIPTLHLLDNEQLICPTLADTHQIINLSFVNVAADTRIGFLGDGNRFRFYVDPNNKITCVYRRLGGYEQVTIVASQRHDMGNLEFEIDTVAKTIRINEETFVEPIGFNQVLDQWNLGGVFEYGTMQADVVHMKVQSFDTPANSYEYYPQSGGAVVYDISGNGNNASHTGSWDTNNTIEPRFLTKGCSVVAGDIVPALLDGSADAQGNVIQFPVGSGIVEGLPTSYRIQEYYPINQKLAAGDYDWAGIDSLVDSIYIEKIKDESKITSLKVNNELPNIGLFMFDENTPFDENSPL